MTRLVTTAPVLTRPRGAAIASARAIVGRSGRPVGSNRRPRPCRPARTELRADLWEATVGRRASRLLDDHLASAARRLVRPAVLDLGAGTGRSLDRLARLGVDVASWTGVEPDAERVALARQRTVELSTARVVAGRLEDPRALDALVDRGPRLVLLSWVLSLVDDPAAAVATARGLAGADGLVVAAACTAVADRPSVLDGWVRRRWDARPVQPTLLLDGALRLGVTMRGRAVVATIAGS